MRSSRSPWYLATLLAALAATSIGLSTPLSAQQILETYNDSLTTYLSGSNSRVQGVRPLSVQRGVTLDGALRAKPGFAMALAGNPFENAWTGREFEGDLRIDIGAYSLFDVDIALPTQGLPWVVGRTFNSSQKNGGGTPFNSNGYQGKNWFQTSQPELVRYDHSISAHANDQIYLIYGADRYIEFTRGNAAYNQFKAKNGAAGVIDYQSGSPDLWVYTDQVGNQFTFFGDNTASNKADWQLWKMTDPDGNVAYVGHATTASTAVTSGYDAGGRITTAYDASDRRYTYTYSTLNSVLRLTQVKAETKTGGTWGSSPTGIATAVQVDYTYYGNESHGDIGDLKQVKITTRLNDSSGETIEQVKRKHYRYWEGSADDTASYDPSTNPGYPHAIKYVYDFEGVRQFDWNWGDDETFDEDHLGVSDDDLESYASVYLEQDSSRRVRAAWFDGLCGCGSGNDGTHSFTFGTNGSFSPSAGYDEEWSTRTVVAKPNGAYLTQYFDELGQGLATVLTDSDPSGSPSNTYVTQVIRDAAGCVTSVHTPENLSSYTHSTGAIASDIDDGFVRTWVREDNGTLTGFALDWLHQKGWDPTPTPPADPPPAYFDGSQTFTTLTKTITNHTVARPLIASRTVYSEEITSGTSGAFTTSYAYTDYSGSSQPLTVEKITQTNPAVHTDHNGSGSSTTVARHFRKDGLLDFQKNEDATIDYWEYTHGRVTRTIRDCDTSLTAGGQELAGVSIPSGFSSSGSGWIRWKTTTTYTSQGFMLLESPPDAARLTYRSRLADHRLVVLTYEDYSAGTPTYYGPVNFSVLNHAGKPEVSGVVALSNNSTTSGQDNHIDETDSDPIFGLALGAIARLSTNIYSETGSHLDESRMYFTVPGSGAGSEGTNYDATRYAYDDAGRLIRVKYATGTIRRTVYDVRDNATEEHVGLNDNGLPHGEPSGSSDMVKTEERAFDTTSSSKNNLLTERMAFKASGSSDDTEQYPDYRGRIISVRTPGGPRTAYKYDNLGRVIAMGQYTAATAIDETTDPTSDTSGRLALEETFYDEMGRVWKSVRHKIDAGDGSDDDTLLTLNWYDERGRMVKVDGPQLMKTRYDRLGRVTDEFVLAVDNDASYSDVVSSSVTSVTGDIVLEQRETRYDATTGTVLLEATISRFHSDVDTGETTGALDTNADTDDLKLTSGDLEGRVQITAKWYDSFERLIDQVEYGTNGGSTFDRDGLSTPARSDTELRTTWAYNTDGTLDTITDPKALVAKRFYDGGGRLTKEVRNYDAGVNGGDPDGTDDNVTVSYGYTNGLRTSLTAVMPNSADNQVTTYIYGTTAGTPTQMKLSSGNLLRAIKYPDSTNTGTDSGDIDSDSSDVVSFAYDAQGREVYKKDQGGNIIETDYDANARITQKRVTTLGSGFDGAVRRIETEYDTLGRVKEVTQYDNAAVASGSVLDEVQHSYDDWGNISSFKQDRNSAISGDEYTVSYAWTKATTGRNTLRKTSVTLPSGTAYGYNYRSRDGLHDAEVSRVTDITLGLTPLVLYDYNGLGMVVGQKYAEPAVQWWEFTPTPGDYPDLDRFNRVVKSRWTKLVTGNPDFYLVELAYDRNSNVVTADDNVHTGFDVKYTMDSVDRLTQALEGTLVTGSITPAARDEQWTLSHTGNWGINQLDLDGDLNYNEAGELNDTRVHDKVNQLNTRDTDTAGGVNYTFAYDGPGNLTDDGQNYKYEWDAFYRLRKVKSQSNALVVEYRYNGLGYRIAEHIDTDTDGDVDANDKWYYDAFDERWRQVARFRESDSSPKEEFLHHAAGLDGQSGSSYIDLVALRNKDANTAWTSASDGVLEDRIYICQNWRADVSAVVSASGAMKEWKKYSAYGVPFGLPLGDANSDGTADSTDTTQIQTWINTPAYDVRGDADLDGDVDSNDKTAVTAIVTTVMGRMALSHIGLDWGFAGGRFSPTKQWEFRNRSLDPRVGRWTKRDPWEYVEGPSLYEYVQSAPIVRIDPSGLDSEPTPGGVFGTAAPDPCADLPPKAKCICHAWANYRRHERECALKTAECLGTALIAGSASAVATGPGGALVGGGISLYCVWKQKRCHGAAERERDQTLRDCENIPGP